MPCTTPTKVRTRQNNNLLHKGNKWVNYIMLVVFWLDGGYPAANLEKRG